MYVFITLLVLFLVFFSSACLYTTVCIDLCVLTPPVCGLSFISIKFCSVLFCLKRFFIVFSMNLHVVALFTCNGLCTLLYCHLKNRWRQLSIKAKCIKSHVFCALIVKKVTNYKLTCYHVDNLINNAMSDV